MAVSSQQEFSTEVAASVRQCFATITDFEKYPAWFSTIEATTVLERRPDGLARCVEYQIDLKIKRIRYVLAYEYAPPERLTWTSVDGDIEAISGAYHFERLAPARTRVTCRQGVTLGFWLPSPVRHVMERQALRQSVLEFKAAAEAAAQAARRRRPAR